MVEYDYTRDLKEMENRIDWLKESYIGAQQHGCFRLAEMIRKELEEAEEYLEDLYELR